MSDVRRVFLSGSIQAWEQNAGGISLPPCDDVNAIPRPTLTFYDDPNGTHALMPVEEYERLRDILEDLVAQACTVNGELDSMATRTGAEALRYLAEIGRVKIIDEHGRRVIAKWVQDDG
jgi:hypothetical protein